VAVHAVPVHAADGKAGEVDGLVIDPATHQVTHVLLREGHLWGRKDVAVPMSAVKEFDSSDTDPDVLRLSLTRQEIGDLPPVPVVRHHR